LVNNVAAPLEEQINGVEGLLYFTSQAASNGTLQHHRHLRDRRRSRTWRRSTSTNRVQAALSRVCPRRCGGRA
jgi:multidrug efflux pump subunit AcrB